jgi:hypothetical protein
MGRWRREGLTPVQVRGETDLVEAFVALNAQGSEGGIVVFEDSVPAKVPSTANRRGNPSWPT